MNWCALSLLLFVIFGSEQSFSAAIADVQASVIPPPEIPPESEPVDLLVQLRREHMYKNLEVVGQGTYGVAFLLNDHVIKVSRMCDSDETCSNILEAAILSSFHHRALPSPVAVQLVTGEHDLYLEIHQPYYEKLPKEPDYILSEISSLLTFMHKLNVAHRDIKPAHLLSNGHGAVLIDWGAADIFTTQPVSWCGTTLSYRSPEAIKGVMDAPKPNDMWSLGVSVVEYCSNCSGRTLPGNSKSEVLSEIKKMTTPANSDDGKNEDTEEGEHTLLRKTVRSFGCPKSEPYLLGLWEQRFGKRMSAKKIEKGLTSLVTDAWLEQPIRAALIAIGRDKLAERRRVYTWILHTCANLGYQDKIAFETMCIADRFLMCCKGGHRDVVLTVLVAFYVTMGMYHDGSSVGDLQKVSQTHYREKTFLKHLYALLEKTKFRIIYSHALRAYQREIFEEMEYSERIAAVALLGLLEIDEKTFVYSNETKWSFVKVLFVEAPTKEEKVMLEQIRELYTRLSDKMFEANEGFHSLKSYVEAALLK